MKLSEKIYNCRKKAGWSQEELAEKLNVSRQAVSKWETGESVPEMGKLKLLAESFHVSIDWLVTEEEEETPDKQAPYNWIESLPGVLGKMIRRYGWLYGLVLAGAGLLFLCMGWLFGAIMESVNSFGGGASVFLPKTNPGQIFGRFITGVGIVLLVAGIGLALVLKLRNRPKKK